MPAPRELFEVQQKAAFYTLEDPLTDVKHVALIASLMLERAVETCVQSPDGKATWTVDTATAEAAQWAVDEVDRRAKELFRVYHELFKNVMKRELAERAA